MHKFQPCMPQTDHACAVFIGDQTIYTCYTENKLHCLNEVAECNTCHASEYSCQIVGQQ